MQPQQPYYQPPSNPTLPPQGSGQSPNYDFLYSQPPAKRSVLPTGSSTMQRLLIFVGGLVVLVFTVVIFSSLLSSGGGVNTELAALVGRQNEIIRVAAIGTQQASGQSTKNLAVSAQLSMATDQQQLTVYLSHHGHKMSKKELAADQSAATDNQLNSALATSTFDTTFNSILQNELNSYMQSLKSTFAKTTNTGTRSLLNSDYQHAQLLLKQVPGSTQS